MKPLYLICLLTSVILGACYSPPKPAPQPKLAGNYVLDPTHTSVIWRVSHVGLSNYTARFDRAIGTLFFDPDTPELSRVNITLDPTSLSTGDAAFDKTIITENQYFAVAKFPEIRFSSTSIQLSGGTDGKPTAMITGDLSFRGRTVPVTLNTVFNGSGKSFGHPGKTLGFSATTTLQRSDFGLNTLSFFGIGDKVSLHIETEFNEK